MTTNHEDDRLDWDTYKALRQVVQDMRLAFIVERESLPANDPMRTDLLLQQITCTDIGAAMLERMLPTTNQDAEKKDS